MNEQTALFDITPNPRKTNREKLSWENRFQNWSNLASIEENTSYGSCGYGAICDYCTDNSYGRPCVRALNTMYREKRLTIDYENTSFEDAWNGALK